LTWYTSIRKGFEFLLLYRHNFSSTVIRSSLFWSEESSGKMFLEKFRTIPHCVLISGTDLQPRMPAPPTTGIV
jgi:hypothetical protein